LGLKAFVGGARGFALTVGTTFAGHRDAAPRSGDNGAALPE
jgi:hypothetical protein